MRPTMRPMKGAPAAARAARSLAALGLAAVLSAGCSFGGRAIAPTSAPVRLLDPTAPAQTAVPTGPAGTPGPAATPAPAARTVTILGVVEASEGGVWTIDGLRVRVAPETTVAPGLGPGSLVRVVARVSGDDDDDGQSLLALSINPVREAPVVGQVVAIEAGVLVVDERRIRIPAGVVLPPGLAPGVIVRVVVDDDSGVLVLRLIEPLPAATVIGGVVELIDDDGVIIGGQRLRLSPETVLWRVRLVLGEPVRVIVVPVEQVLTIVSITVVTIVVPPPVLVLPMPTATVYVAPPPPPPAPRPAPPSNSGSGDDDDDDDD